MRAKFAHEGFVLPCGSCLLLGTCCGLSSSFLGTFLPDGIEGWLRQYLLWALRVPGWLFQHRAMQCILLPGMDGVRSPLEQYVGALGKDLSVVRRRGRESAANLEGCDFILKRI